MVSGKLEKFNNSDEPSLTEPHLHAMHLDLHHFHEGKSKILGNNEMSKMIGMQTVRKNRPDKKHSMSQTRQLSKWVTNDKWQSCATERKFKNSTKEGPKKIKRKTDKEESLKEKLECFKVDMMKLAAFYEENELIKTKMSS
jgi:hypothetical protein